MLQLFHTDNLAISVHSSAPKPGLIWLCVLVLACAALFTPTADAGNVYRWKSADGTVHYGEHPPKGAKATLLHTTTGKRAKSTKRRAPVSRPVTADGSEAPDPTDAKAPPPKKDPEICKRAQHNLTVLTERARIRQTDENGEERFLSDEEKEEQKEAAQTAVDAYCS